MLLFTYFQNPNHLGLVNKDIRSWSLIQTNISALCSFPLSIFSSTNRHFFFLFLELIDAPCSSPITGPMQPLGYSVLPYLCIFSYWWSTGIIPYWLTFTPNTHYSFVFLHGFKSFLMSYRKILATHSTLVNPAQSQVEELCRAPFGGRESDKLSAMLRTLSPPAPCTNNHAGFAFLFACRHIACLTALVAQLSFDSDPLILPHSLLLGRTLMPIIALGYTREAGGSTLC